MFGAEEAGPRGRYRIDTMRVLTIVNLALWTVLFMAWIPFTIEVGLADPISTEVSWILIVTAVLMGALAALRIRRGRPVLG